MRTWIYDGTFEGLLTTVAILIETHERPAAVEHRMDHLLRFGEEVQVTTDSEKAAAFLERLRKEVSEDVARRVVRVGMADRLRAEVPLYRFVCLALEKGPDVINFHAHPDVHAINEIALSVGREIHRLKGLLRFRETQDGWLWGPITPDHNVSAAVAQHFRKRMPAERWMIHDIVRQLVVAWDGQDWALRERVDPQGVKLSTHEKDVQQWWRTFYREIAIANRSNPRLQAQNMPRRYWACLIEEPRPTRPWRARSRRQTYDGNPPGDKSPSAFES